jgi:adenylate cyclase
MMKKKVAVASIALLCFLFLSLLYGLHFFQTINTRLTDPLYGGATPLSNIVIIAIDDKSLQEIGRWPWDRIQFARLFEKTKDARVVGVDVAFFEPSTAQNDKALVEAIRKAGNIVLTAEYTEFEMNDDAIHGTKALVPVMNASAHAKLGYVNIVTDNDGITRAVNLDIKGQFKSFAEQIYESYLGKRFESSSRRFLINYAGKPGSFTTYSFSDVLAGNMSFKDKIVLVGATSPDLHDDYFVPTSKGKAMPGVEVHANTLQTMLTKKYLYEQSSVSVLIALLIVCILSSLLIYNYGILKSSIALFGIIIAYVFGAIVLFRSGVILNIVYPVIGIIMTYTASVVYSYKAEKDAKSELKNAFSKYVSPLLVNEIIKNPDKLKLGGEKRRITILFSDIRGFTTISEALGPEKLVHFLNEYLTEMTNIVLKNRGVVDKFIGDAVMAFWGAPLDEKKQEYLSCKASVEMILKLIELRKGWTHLPHIDIGVGLNEGECVVGNMGSHDRFDYTAIGDAVNLASRLEGLNKQYGTNVIVSENVYDKVKKDFTFRELDFVKVKGKTRPVKIYELVIDADKNNIKTYESGLKKYISKDFDGALREFTKLHDKASKMFVERCNFLIKNPPKEWDGSFEHTSK